MVYINFSNVVRKMGISNKVQELNTKKLLIYLYCYLPVFFYLPLFYLTNKLGSVSINFYYTVSVDSEVAKLLLIGHFVLGMMVIFFLKDINFKIQLVKAPLAINLLYFILYFLYCFVLKISYIQFLLFPLLIIIAARFRLSMFTYFCLFLISVLQMEINEDRYMLIFSLMLWLLPVISRQNILRLMIMTVFSIFLMIFILQPLRYGELPFSNFSNMFESVFTIFTHIQPLYIAGVLGTSLDLSLKSLIVEFIPFGKSFSGDIGIVEKTSRNVLPDYVLNRGTRLGSNSSSYFSVLGFGVISSVLLFLNRTINFLKLKLLKQSLILYFVFNGPYFFRRSIGSYIIDIIIIIFIVLIICFILQLNKQKGLMPND